MSTSPIMDKYPNEKVVEVLPAPVTASPAPRRPSVGVLVLKFMAAFFGALFLLNILSDAVSSSGLSLPGCHRQREQQTVFGDDGHQHPIPPIEHWKPFQGFTHFELDPSQASGLAVTGHRAFGKVVFETSKLSDKVVIDLDIRTNKKNKNDEVSVSEEDGHLTIDTPKHGPLETYASARIQIPSNMIGVFGMPHFALDLPRHMVDFSSLPESLEIGSFDIHVARGFIKAGPVHTNTTNIDLASGAIRGSLTHARNETKINVPSGNVTLDIASGSKADEAHTDIHLGHGHLKGSFAVHNRTSFDVASGSIYVSVDLQDGSGRSELVTNIASGPARVFVNSIASERLFEASHRSVSGDQLITYPANFQGTVDARSVVGDIKLDGKDLAVEKVLGGMVGKKGDSDRNSVSVKALKGGLDILVGDESGQNRR